MKPQPMKSPPVKPSSADAAEDGATKTDSNSKDVPAPAAGPPAWLLEYGPLLVFLALFRLKDIYWATGAFMAALTLAMATAWFFQKKLPPALLFSGGIILPLGGLTIYFHDPRFLYVKPTIVGLVSGLVLLGGLVRGKALLKPLLGAQLHLNDAGWRALSLRFALFSFGLAAANEYVWRTYTRDREKLWVLFKFPGIPVLTALFFISQLPLIKRCEVPNEP